MTSFLLVSYRIPSFLEKVRSAGVEPQSDTGYPEAPITSKTSILVKADYCQGDAVQNPH